MPKHGDSHGSPNWAEARREVYNELSSLRDELEKMEAAFAAAKAEANRANARIDIFEAKVISWSVMIGAVVPTIVRLALEHFVK